MTAKSRGGLRGGSCWFAVESKTFEISTEVVGEKLRGVVLERSRGFSSWIRFGELSLCCLRERVEACCSGELRLRCLKVWEDGGQKFRLEFRSNETVKSSLFPLPPTLRSKFAALRSMKGTYVDAAKVKLGRVLIFGSCVVILERGVESFMGKVLQLLRWDASGMATMPRKFREGSVWIATSGGRIILLCRSFMVGSTTLGLLGGSDDQVVWELWVGGSKGFADSVGDRLAKGTASGLEKGDNCGETDGNMVVWRGEELGQGDVQPREAPRLSMLVDCPLSQKRIVDYPLSQKRLGQLQIPSSMEIGGLRRCQSMESRVEGLLASRPEIIDEALMDKAFSAVCGLEDSLGGNDYDPLRVVLANESALGNESLEEQILSLVDCTFAIGLALVPNGWIPKRLWSMPIEGFKEEILYLLKRTKTRIDQRGQAGTNRRTISLPSRFERELKKLEWTLNYKGSSKHWVLKFVGLEAEVYSISCHFKNWEDGGDFSMIRFLREHSRGGGLSPYMRRFSEVIKQLELRDSLGVAG
ncbi:hypothetical protein CK203_049140 [Vitis vinifera]|uniref:DUF4283 domain-containing protein n=1 Tax=Vitis vinifera TaxID=29760 RepID=A0A438GV71_VITVI|nr:hypothetical protein CK203_049140 [Vitis vinifera]